MPQPPEARSPACDKISPHEPRRSCSSSASRRVRQGRQGPIGSDHRRPRRRLQRRPLPELPLAARSQFKMVLQPGLRARLEHVRHPWSLPQLPQAMAHDRLPELSAGVRPRGLVRTTPQRVAAPDKTERLTNAHATRGTGRLPVLPGGDGFSNRAVTRRADPGFGLRLRPRRRLQAGDLRPVDRVLAQAGGREQVRQAR